MTNKLRIAWIPPSKNLGSASFRLRVAEIMKGLRERGHTCEFYSECVESEVLIVSKKYDSETLKAMERFRARSPQSRIVFDLCDNHFFTDTQDPRYLRAHGARVSALQRALSLADAVTSSSKYLADVVAERCGIDPRAIFVIDDCYETENERSRMHGFSNLLAEIRYRWLEWRLNCANQAKDRFVWFGTHGVSYAEGGMFDLLERRNVITEALCDRKKSLTIISNSYKKYREVSKELNIHTYYLPWHQNTVDRALRLHTFLLLPIKPSPFTFSKSANRPVTAMLNRLLVICDMIPAYEKLRDLVISPVNTASLKLAISMPEAERILHTDGTMSFIQSSYSSASISTKWEGILVSITSRKSTV